MNPLIVPTNGGNSLVNIGLYCYDHDLEPGPARRKLMADGRRVIRMFGWWYFVASDEEIKGRWQLVADMFNRVCSRYVC